MITQCSEVAFYVGKQNDVVGGSLVWLCIFFWFLCSFGSVLLTAALGKIFTEENLQKWKIIRVDWCCMYKKDGEMVDHVLLLCPVAFEVCSSFFSLLGIICYASLFKICFVVGEASLEKRSWLQFGLWSRNVYLGVYGKRGILWGLSHVKWGLVGKKISCYWIVKDLKEWFGHSY